MYKKKKNHALRMDCMTKKIISNTETKTIQPFCRSISGIITYDHWMAKNKYIISICRYNKNKPCTTHELWSTFKSTRIVQHSVLLSLFSQLERRIRILPYFRLFRNGIWLQQKCPIFFCSQISDKSEETWTLTWK